MKYIIFGIIFLTVIGITVFAFSKRSHPATQSVPISHQEQHCQRDQIKATFSSEGAAGNIYGQLTMTNISSKPCHISLGNTITITTDTHTIVSNYTQKSPTTDFVLAPGATVYSHVHFPNGPQCQSGVAQKAISFLYTTIEFRSITKTPILVQACVSPSEKTIIDIWPLSQIAPTP